MGAKPSPLEIADEMHETLGPSKAALEDAVKLQYNMVDLFNMGEVAGAPHFAASSGGGTPAMQPPAPA